MILPAQTIAELCQGDRPLISPFQPERLVISGKSAGLSAASYDCRIDHDLVLGVNPAHIIAAHIMLNGFDAAEDLQDALAANPPSSALAFTVEDFDLPPDISGAVCDKSSYARVFVSAFNTFFDPGFHGNATLELVNLGDQPVVYKKGDPVCQFLFSRLEAPTDRPYDGKYQHQSKAAHGPRYEMGDRRWLQHMPNGATIDTAPGLKMSAQALTQGAAALGNAAATSVRNARQTRVEAWVQACFGEAAIAPYERAERVVEEALELGQCEGVVGGRLSMAVRYLLGSLSTYQLGTMAALHVENVRQALRDDRVAVMAEAIWSKPSGTPGQEAGGVGTCLLAYCESRGISADAAEAQELDRITALPPEHFRARHAAKFVSGLAIKPPSQQAGQPHGGAA